jgi:hypothetical protein
MMPNVVGPSPESGQPIRFEKEVTIVVCSGAVWTLFGLYAPDRCGPRRAIP